MKVRPISQVLNHLASMPGLAHAMVTRAEARAILAETGGDLLAQGQFYDVVLESRGAGMYTVRLKRRDS